MVHSKRRVAIYCRVSTADQSCDRQERDLSEYADKAGYHVVGVWKETASGVRADRKERQKVLALAQARKIDTILVTEMTRWGRSTVDLLQSLQQLEAWNVSLVAQTGLQFDLSTPQGKLIASLLAAIAEFERDLARERIKSGLASARANGKKIGRQAGENIVGDRLEPTILEMSRSGKSYRQIANELKCSKNTVNAVLQRYRRRLVGK